MRDNKVLESFKKKIEKNLKEMNIFKHLRQEVIMVLMVHKAM